jgi:hypothetical protein
MKGFLDEKQSVVEFVVLGDFYMRRKYMGRRVMSRIGIAMKPA